MSAPDPKGICGAKSRSGKPCKLRAGHGTAHVGEGRCRRHGGASPQAELAGVIVLARREATLMGQPMDIHPHEAILECIRISAGEVRYCSEQIADLDQAIGPVLTVVEQEGDQVAGVGSYTRTTQGPPALHVWISARHVAMDRLVGYSKVALAAGVEERHVRVAEKQGAAFAAMMRAILLENGVDPADPKVRESVRRHLTLVSSAA